MKSRAIMTCAGSALALLAHPCSFSIRLANRSRLSPPSPAPCWSVSPRPGSPRCPASPPRRAPPPSSRAGRSPDRRSRPGGLSPRPVPPASPRDLRHRIHSARKPPAPRACSAPLPVSPPRTLLDRVPGQEDRIEPRPVDRLDRLLAQQPDELQPVVFVPRPARVDQLADLGPPIAQPPAPPVGVPDPQDKQAGSSSSPGSTEPGRGSPDVVDLGRGARSATTSGAMPPLVGSVDAAGMSAISGKR